MSLFEDIRRFDSVLYKYVIIYIIAVKMYSFDFRLHYSIFTSRKKELKMMRSGHCRATCLSFCRIRPSDPAISKLNSKVLGKNVR